MMKRFIAPAVLALMAMAGPAYANCPTAPDGPDSHYVDNGRTHTLCLNRQLEDTSTQLRDKAQWNNLVTSVQRNEIQRRFDNLPEIGRN
jgi:hypothetical protein